MSPTSSRGTAGSTGSVAASAAALPAPELNVLLPPPSVRAEPGRLVVGVIAGCVALVALVNPKLPGNSGPVDLLIMASIAATFLWALRTRVPVRLPYAIPLTALMITGLVAALVSKWPWDGLTAVLQEIFLLFWCATIATVCTTPRVLQVVLRTWIVSATAWGALLVVAVAGHVNAISGVGTTADKLAAGMAADSSAFRGRLFFDQPNMAGNYFMIALFILVAAGYPRRRWLRASCGVVLLAALVVTGSNAAFASLLGGAALTLFLHVRARRGMVKAFAAVGVAVIGIAIFSTTVGVPLVSTAQTSNNLLLHDTVGRAPQSAAGRATLFEWQFKLYEHGNLLGIGPNGTQNALSAAASPILKSAHNDYLGTLDERGPVGLLAVFVLMGAATARLVAFTRRPLPRRLGDVLPVPGALAGACLAFALTALTHETLHYRWLFTLLGVVAAVHLLQRREEMDPAVGRTSAGPRPAVLRRSLSPARDDAHRVPGPRHSAEGR